MKSLNYLIIGPKNKAKYKANEIAMDFFQTTNEFSQSCLIIKPEEEKITVSQIEWLVNEMSMTSLWGDKKGYIIEEANKITGVAQNKLLKLLEETQNNQIQIFWSESQVGIIETILSRLMLIEIPGETDEEIKEIFLAEEVDEKYFDTLLAIFDEASSAINFFKNNKKDLDNILDFIKLLDHEKIKAYLFFKNEFKNFDNQLMLKILESYYSKHGDINKVCLLLDIKEKFKTNANKKMQIERIFWE